MKLAIIGLLALSATGSCFGQNYTCNQIGNQTNCYETSPPRTRTITPPIQTYDIAGSVTNAYNAARQRALDQREQELRIQLLEMQKQQAQNSQYQQPEMSKPIPPHNSIGQSSNNSSPALACTIDCCMLAGLSKGMGNQNALALLNYKLSVAGLTNDNACIYTASIYSDRGKALNTKSLSQLTSEELKSIALIKEFEAAALAVPTH